MRPPFRFLLSFVAAFATAAVPAPGAADEPILVVYAAASLRESLEAATPAFTARSGIQVRYSFGGSDTLATQLLAGAPADVFISANETQARRVRDGGLAAEPLRILAHNHLVVVAGNARIRTLADLRTKGTRLVLAAPSVPAGAYAREALTALAKRTAYGSAYADEVLGNIVSDEVDVKAVATKVALGEADAGIVYATDVTPELAPRVRVLAFPEGISPDAAYPIAVLRTSKALDSARAYVGFLLSPGGGQRVLREHGFSPP